VVRATPDGFLAVRAGPSTSYRLKYHARPGQVLAIDGQQSLDDPQRKWRHVVGVLSRTDGRRERAPTLLDGWAAGRFLNPVACPE
jgi:hypothetical protein